MFQTENRKDNSKPLCFIISVLIIFFTILSFYNNKIFAQNKFCNIYIINTQNKKIKLHTEIADTDASRSRGLMFRKHLEKNSGMLFKFDKEMILSFWMKNTYIPLSIAYIDKHGIINDILLMRALDSSVIYKSGTGSKFAIEVNQGWFKKHNITEGCRLIINGCIGKQN